MKNHWVDKINNKRIRWATLKADLFPLCNVTAALVIGQNEELTLCEDVIVYAGWHGVTLPASTPVKVEWVERWKKWVVIGWHK